MIGIDFWAFLVLLVAGLIAAAVLHCVVRYRLFERFDGFLAKWITGWIGAWLGSPVLGHWFEPVKLANVYLIPALLGAFAGGFIVAAWWKALAKGLCCQSELRGGSLLDRLFQSSLAQGSPWVKKARLFILDTSIATHWWHPPLFT